MSERGVEAMAAQSHNGIAVDTTVDGTIITRIASSSSGAGNRPACFDSTLQEILFVLTTTMAVGMSSFLVGSTTVITSFAGKDLHMSNAEVTWITASSSLTAGAFLLFFGRLADMFGRKMLFVSSMGLFAICSLITGFATNALFLDSFNGLLGLCSAAAVPPAVGSLGAIYSQPSKRKNYAFACFSAGNPLGFVFGTLFSGIATNIFSWRASFWLLAIIYAVFTVAAIYTVPRAQGTNYEHFGWDALKRFDIIATILSVSGIAMFSSSLSLAGDAPQGWRTPYVPVLLSVGLVLIGVFIYWESIFKYPLMPLHVWLDRDFSLIMLILALGFSAFVSATFWISLYMQRVQHLSALLVAVHLLPMAINGIIVNIIAGVLLHRISNRILIYIATVAYAISFLLLALQKENSSYWAFIFPALFLVVVGADLEFNVANMYVMSSLPSNQQSVAGGIFNTLSRLCSTISLGITTAIYSATSTQSSSRNSPLKPYAAVFWFSFGCAALSICLVPFVRIGTQGGKKKKEPDEVKAETIVNGTTESALDAIMPKGDLETGQPSNRDADPSYSSSDREKSLEKDSVMEG